MFATSIALIVSFASQSAVTSPLVNRPDFWQYASVIYAEVRDVKQDTPRSLFSIELKPIATLTGPFDSALHQLLTVKVTIGTDYNGILSDRPSPGDKMILLIERGIEQYSVPSGQSMIFPQAASGDRRCILTVASFDDPKVTETIENLRKLRAKHREEAENNAAAKPVAAPPAAPKR